MRSVQPGDVAVPGGQRNARRSGDRATRVGLPVRKDGHWLWIGGPVPPGFSGMTIGSLVIVRGSAADAPGFARLLCHELVHVRQWRLQGGPRFLAGYVAAYLKWRLRGYPHIGAYRRIPAEIEATWESAELDASAQVKLELHALT